MTSTDGQHHHLHAQHGDVFVPVHGGNTMPDFDSLVAAEQRELMEDELEDAEAEANERTRLLSHGERRRSVAFDSEAHAKSGTSGRPGGYSGLHADAAQDGSHAESDSKVEREDNRPAWRKPGLTW